MANIKLVFDMDGTIYPLYQQFNWLERLLNEEPDLFNVNEFIGDYLYFTHLLRILKSKGYEIAICTWTPKNVSPEYVKLVEQEKTDWLEAKFGLDFFDEFYALPYGTNKANSFQSDEYAILFDDNQEVGNEWKETAGFLHFSEKEMFNILELLALLE